MGFGRAVLQAERPLRQVEAYGYHREAWEVIVHVVQLVGGCVE